MVEPDALILRANIHITGIQPAITRILELLLDLNLAQLHEVLQATFGWTDSHLHQFDIGGLTYGASEFDQDGWSDRQIFEASSVRLADEDVLAIVRKEQRILVVTDRDFGELIFHKGLPHAQLSHHFGSGGLKVAELRHFAKALLICGAKPAWLLRQIVP